MKRNPETKTMDDARRGAFWPALAGVLPLTLLLILALVWESWHERQRLLNDGARTLQSETSLLATHLGYAMEAVELSLIDFSRDLLDHPGGSAEWESLLLALEDRVAVLPQLTEMRLYGGTGQWRGSSDPRQQPVPLDAALLREHNDNGRDFVVLGPAPFGRPRGHFLSVSRSVRGDSDEMVGLAQALIDVDCFGGLCGLDVMELVVAGVLVDQDQRVLAGWRRDGQPPPLGERVGNIPVFQIFEQADTLRPLDLLEDGDSLVAVGLPQGIPWRVALAADRDRLLLSWRQRLWQQGILLCGLLVVLSMFLVYIRGQDRRQGLMDRRLADAMAEQTAIFDSAAEGIALTVDQRLVRVNQRFASIVGYPAEQLEGMPTCELLVDETSCQHLGEGVAAALERGSHYEAEWQLRRHDGQLIWCHLSGASLDSREPQQGMVWCIDDITERKHMESELRRLATVDTLTGLLNRRCFSEIAEQELRLAHRHARPLALLMLDLDHFKQVNDNHGHSAGDQVLQVVTRSCYRLLRSTDSFGRLGGEEFAVLLPDTDRAGAVEVAEKLRETVASLLIRVDEKTLRMTMSIGVACRQMDDQSLTGLLSRADHALYRAKAAGRNCTRCDDGLPSEDIHFLGQ